MGTGVLVVEEFGVKMARGATVLIVDFNADCRRAQGGAVRRVRSSLRRTFPRCPLCYT